MWWSQTRSLRPGVQMRATTTIDTNWHLCWQHLPRSQEQEGYEACTLLLPLTVGPAGLSWRPERCRKDLTEAAAKPGLLCWSSSLLTKHYIHYRITVCGLLHPTYCVIFVSKCIIRLQNCVNSFNIIWPHLVWWEHSDLPVNLGKPWEPFSLSCPGCTLSQSLHCTLRPHAAFIPVAGCREHPALLGWDCRCRIAQGDLWVGAFSRRWCAVEVDATIHFQIHTEGWLKN